MAKVNQREFKALLESLGLTAEWLAREFDVLDSVAQRWAAGKAPAPKVAMRKLREIDNQFRRRANTMLRELELLPRVHAVNLLAYATDADLWEFHPDFGNIPVTAHRVMLERTKQKLEAAGYTVRIVVMDRHRYFQWLGRRKDSSDLRAGWAKEQATPQTKPAGPGAAKRTTASPGVPGRKNWTLRLKDPQIFIDREAISAKEFNSLIAKYDVTFECVAYVEDVPLDTVRKWASGEIPVMMDVEAGMRFMNDLLEHMAEAYLSHICPPSERTGRKLEGKMAHLAFYPTDADRNFFEHQSRASALPSASYLTAMKRVEKKIAAAGGLTNRVLLTVEEYLRWLDGRKDTEALQLEWVKLKVHQESMSGMADEDEDEFEHDMTPGQFRELRISVGLSVDKLAEFFEIEPDTVDEWESGESAIPGYVVHDLLVYDGKIEDLVAEFRTVMYRQEDQGDSRHVFSMPGFRSDEDLWEYFPDYRPYPVEMYQALLKRVEKVLQNNNCLLAVYQFDFSAYRKWLGKRKDTIATRHQWDNLQIVLPDSNSVN